MNAASEAGPKEIDSRLKDVGGLKARSFPSDRCLEAHIAGDIALGTSGLKATAWRGL
jgi:hypothetical protein